MTKVAIIKTSALGDIVQTLTALKSLKESDSTISVDWVIEAASREILEEESVIAMILPVTTKGFLRAPLRYIVQLYRSILRLREKKYDSIIDLQGNLKSFIILFFMRSPRKIGFGWKTVPEKINLLGTNERYDPPSGQNIRDDYLYLLQKAFPSIPSISTVSPPERGAVLLCPFSKWKNKELSKETLSIIVKALLAKDVTLSLLAATPAERSRAEKWALGIPIFEPTSLTEFKQGVKNFSHLISVDSFPLHMGDLKGVATFSIFGPSSPNKYAPKGAPFFKGSCPYGVTFEKRCPYLRSCKTGACLKELSQEEITSLVSLLLHFLAFSSNKN